MAVGGLRVRAVLLDALGTLVELQPPAPRLRVELSERFGLEVSHVQAERAIAAEIAYYRTHLGQGRDKPSLDALRARCAEVLAHELASQLDQPVPAGQDMVDALLASLSFSVFADVPGALAELQAMGLALVVVSNWDVSLTEALERLGVLRWLDGVVVSAQVGAAKPDPAVFQRALEVAGAAPAQALHVGDSLPEDVQGARAAGIEAVLISRSGSPAPPQRESSMLVVASGVHGSTPRHTIRTLRELPRLVSAPHGRRSADLL